MSQARKHLTALLMVFAFVLAVFAAGGCGGGGPSSSGSSSSDSSSSEESTEAAAELTMDDVESIQAYTDATFYGTGLVQVDITYNDDVDVSGVTADSYVLMDRGSLSPEFGEIPIESVEINGQVVTLNISNHHSYATDSNVLVYTGDDKEGSRQRNALGIYCTGAWYRDVNGTIYYSDGDEEAGYEANETGMGYQVRASLELKLRHSNEDDDAFACLADEETGKYDDSGLWLETIDRQIADDLDTAIAEGQFISLEDAGILVDSTAKNATDGTGNDYVKGYVYVPENPDGSLVVTLQGLGISYWQLSDGTNNDGCGFMYDSCTSSWADTHPNSVVVNIHDRSWAAADLGDYDEMGYDFVQDDANVMKALIEKYNLTGPIVLQSNSRGSFASAVLIQALAGQPYNPANQNADLETPEEDDRYLSDYGTYDFQIDAYVCQNGSFGFNYEEDDWEAVANTGLRVWVFEGEQDNFSSTPEDNIFNNSETVVTYEEYLTDAGYDEDWIAENLRRTVYTSDLFYPWGESDHSVTRINGWYFCDDSYYGPDLEIDDDGEIVYNTKLSDGDTYTIECRGVASTLRDASDTYTVYADKSFHEWALEADAE